MASDEVEERRCMTLDVLTARIAIRYTTCQVIDVSCSIGDVYLHHTSIVHRCRHEHCRIKIKVIYAIYRSGKDIACIDSVVIDYLSRSGQESATGDALIGGDLCRE